MAAWLGVSVFDELLPDMVQLTTPAAWGKLLDDACDRILDRFGRLAAALASEPGPPDSSATDLATTLAVAVVCRPWVGLVSVGDCFVVTRSGDGHLDLVLPPDPEGLHAGEATFLTSFTAQSRAKVWTLWNPELTGIALSTDGLADLALEFAGSTPLRPHQPFFDAWFRWADDPAFPSEKLVSFLASDRVCRQTGDDKTLVLAVPLLEAPRADAPSSEPASHA